MSERKLASIQKILNVKPIKDADRIELVSVLGWQCIAKKNEFKAGDLVVYFEIDSFLPVIDKYEFLRERCYRKSDYMGEGFKLKTVHLKGEYSQGLCLPVSYFDELKDIDIKEGLDVTDILNIRKWEEPEDNARGNHAGKRPDFIPKTEETRIQSCPDLLNEFKDLEYYITTKLDGQSHSIAVKDGELTYTSHNMLLKDDGKCSFINYVKEQGITDKLLSLAKEQNLFSVVIQGEWCGEGIQKNPLKLLKHKWFAFTVIINDRRVSLSDMQKVCADIGADIVPIEETGENLLDKYPDVNALLERASNSKGYNNTMAEGIIIRPVKPIYCSKIGTSLSMKVINNKYLLKNA